MSNEVKEQEKVQEKEEFNDKIRDFIFVNLENYSSSRHRPANWPIDTSEYQLVFTRNISEILACRGGSSIIIMNNGDELKVLDSVDELIEEMHRWEA